MNQQHWGYQALHSGTASCLLGKAGAGFFPGEYPGRVEIFRG